MLGGQDVQRLSVVLNKSAGGKQLRHALLLFVKGLSRGHFRTINPSPYFFCFSS